VLLSCAISLEGKRVASSKLVVRVMRFTSNTFVYAGAGIKHVIAAGFVLGGSLGRGVRSGSNKKTLDKL
jgi:hypothetical protein